MNETLLKHKSYIKNHTLTGGDFNTLLSPLDRTVRQKINREIRELTDVMTKMDLTDIYKTFHPNILSSQHLMKPSQKLTTYSVTKQTSIHTKNWNNPMYFIRSP